MDGRWVSRRARLFQAVLNRIGEQGDMPIRISTRTFAEIIRALGLRWEIHGDETHREIDAIALQALITKANW